MASTISEQSVIAPGSSVRLERVVPGAGHVVPTVQAAQSGLPLTRTLAGTMLTLRRDGELALRPEGPRRRGIHPAAT